MLFSQDDQLNKKRYQIIKIVGGGGLGIAYLAKDTKKNCLVVIKHLNKIQLQTIFKNRPDFDKFFDDELQQNFINEVVTLASFDHPNIVKTYPNVLEETGVQCMVMD